MQMTTTLYKGQCRSYANEAQRCLELTSPFVVDGALKITPTSLKKRKTNNKNKLRKQINKQAPVVYVESVTMHLYQMCFETSFTLDTSVLALKKPSQEFTAVFKAFCPAFSGSDFKDWAKCTVHDDNDHCYYYYYCCCYC